MTNKSIQLVQSAGDSHAAGHAVGGAMMGFSWVAKLTDFLPASVADFGIFLGGILTAVLIYKHLLEAKKTRLETKLKKLEIKEKLLKIKELEDE